MKSKFIMLPTVLLMSVFGFSQKNQIKEAQTNFESGNFEMSMNILNKAEYLVVNAPSEDKIEFFFLRGKTMSAMANKNIEIIKNLSLAVKSYKDLIATEDESGKIKYSVQAKTAIKDIKDSLEKSALEDASTNKYNDCANKMNYLYEMDTKDTLKLFYTASYNMLAKDYDNAIKNYEKLRTLNFSGKGMNYHATNKSTKKETLFVSKTDRDLSVNAGTHDKPRNEISPPKKMEILKNMAFIYTTKNDGENAENYYKKIIELDPKYSDAYLRIAYIKLDKKKSLMDDMANLGTSEEDMKKYDEVKIKKDNLIKEAIPYLEKVNVLEPQNTDSIKLLLNAYRALDMNAEYAALKEKCKC
jgi:tetratricopeptide (TPR) repeat protein